MNSTIGSVRPAYVLPATYFGLCVIVAVVPAEGSWGWFVPFVAAFPFSILLLPATKILSPLLAFGIFGTLSWYAVGRTIGALARRVARTRHDR